MEVGPPLLPLPYPLPDTGKPLAPAPRPEAVALPSEA